MYYVGRIWISIKLGRFDYKLLLSLLFSIIIIMIIIFIIIIVINNIIIIIIIIITIIININIFSIFLWRRLRFQPTHPKNKLLHA